MSEFTRHTVRITSTYREAALWVLWRLCALPTWAMRTTVALVGPHMHRMPEYASTVARIVIARTNSVRGKPGTTYVGVVTAVVLLAVFSGLIGHVA